MNTRQQILKVAGEAVQGTGIFDPEHYDIDTQRYEINCQAARRHADVLLLQAAGVVRIKPATIEAGEKKIEGVMKCSLLKRFKLSEEVEEQLMASLQFLGIPLEAQS